MGNYPTPIDDIFQDLGMLAMLRGEHEKAASYFELIAAPGVWDLLYASANAELGAFATVEQTRIVLSALEKIWPEQNTMRGSDILDWVALHHPFQMPEMSNLLLRGAEHVFKRGET